MKLSLILLALVSIFIVSWKVYDKYEEKKFQVQLSQQEWSSRYLWVTVAINQLKKSNGPANEILPLCDSLNKFANDLAIQLQPQFLAQAKADSAANSKPKNK